MSENLRINNINNKYPYLNDVSNKDSGVSEQASIFLDEPQNTSNIQNVQQQQSSTPLQEYDVTIEELEGYLSELKKDNGIVGKAWDGIKGLFNSKTSSKYIEEQIDKLKRGDPTVDKKEIENLILKYEKGQKEAVNTVADIGSCIAAFACYSAALGGAIAAPFTGGASLAITAGAIAAASAAGAATKVAVKGLDAATSENKNYSLKQAGKDALSGAINGPLAAVTAGVSYGVAKIGARVGIGVAATAVEAAESRIVVGFGKSVSTRAAQAIFDQAVEQGLAQAGQSAQEYVATTLKGMSKQEITALESKVLDSLAQSTMLEGATGLAQENLANDKLVNKLIYKTSQGATEGGAMGAMTGGANYTLDSAFDPDKKFNTGEMLTTMAESGAGGMLVGGALGLGSGLIEEGVSKVAASRAASAEATGEKAIIEAKPATQEVLSEEQEAALAQLRKYSDELAKEYSAGTNTLDTMTEFKDALGFEYKGEVVPTETGYGVDTSLGRMTARAKGEESVYSKLKNKYLSGKIDMPESATEASQYVGDAQGLRIVLKNADASGYDITLQTQDFVDEFSQAIKNGDVIVKEIHNYAGPNGTPYLTTKQVDTLESSYKAWFDTVYKEAEQGSSRYEIIDSIMVKDRYGRNVSADRFIDRELNQTFVREIRIDTGVDAVRSNGYTAAQFNLVGQEGQLAELQLRGQAVDTLSEVEHIVYDISKGKSTVAASQYDEIREVLAKVKNSQNLSNAYNEYFYDVYDICRKYELGDAKFSDVGTFDELKAFFPDIRNYGELSANLSDQELYTLSIDYIENLHRIMSASKGTK